MTQVRSSETRLLPSESRLTIQSKHDLDSFLREDCYAHNEQQWRHKFRVTRRPLFYQRLLRKSEYWSNCRKDPIGLIYGHLIWLRTRRLGERLGYSIPRNVFGPGLSIAHTGTIVVNMHAQVGKNCRIHQGVTIGEANGRFPLIGDDVFLGPNVVVIGAEIGDRASAWANSVVTRDVPADCSVAGAPARAVSPRPGRDTNLRMS